VTEELGQVVKAIDESTSEMILDRQDSSVIKYLQTRIEKGEEPKVQLPHMSFEVKHRAGGEGGNINVAVKFTKDFEESLNDEKAFVTDDDVPNDFIEMYHDSLYNGEKKDDLKLGINPQATSWVVVQLPKIISDAARKHTREGKEYVIETGLGDYIFTMEDGDIKARFTGSKLLKQSFKDDSQLK